VVLRAARFAAHIHIRGNEKTARSRLSDRINATLGLGDRPSTLEGVEGALKPGHRPGRAVPAPGQPAEMSAVGHKDGRLYAVRPLLSYALLSSHVTF
jgi:hypothetical protein